MACVVLAVLYIISLAYKRWKYVREFDAMEKTNSRADRVLEEIGMRSMNEDDDDDMDNGRGSREEDEII